MGIKKTAGGSYEEEVVLKSHSFLGCWGEENKRVP